MAVLEQIEGTYNSTFYRDLKTGNCTFTIQSTQEIIHRNSYGSINCKGQIPILNKGLPIIVYGDWQQQKNGNYYFKVEKIENNTNNMETLISFFKNNAFVGIGEKMAERILDYTGPDIYSFIKEHKNADELLSENVKGITLNCIQNMIRRIKETSVQQEIFEYLKPFGCDYENVEKVYNLWENNWLIELSKNPYWGYKANIDFYICDAIAKHMGFPIYHQKRSQSIIYKAIEDGLSKGSTFITLEEFKHNIALIEQKSVYCDKLHPIHYLRFLPKTKNITIFEHDEEKCITLSHLFLEEKEIIRHINRLFNSKKALPYKEEYVAEVENRYHITYGSSQKQALSCLTNSGLKVITGGPGTGKTTVINGLIYILHKMFPNEEVLLLAPTGRAAQRMKEATMHEAFTIHKGLEYKPFGDDVKPERDDVNPLPYKFIIVDEVSMIDTELLSMLLTAISNGSLVIFTGDVAQLPSVGVGNILKDLMNFKDIIPVYLLSDTYRQQNDSGLFKNILEFQKKDIILQNYHDFEIIRCSTEKEVGDKVFELGYQYYLNNPSNSVQIISPIKKQAAGTFVINKRIQHALQKDNYNVLYDNSHYQIGDKVILNRNNYDEMCPYYNGDIGEIEEITEKDIFIKTPTNVITCPKSNLDDLSLAYAITVHKSQGSEFPIVIIALPKTTLSMLDKNLLFTAITRASQKVYLVIEDDALDIAVHSEQMINRQSTLDWQQNKNIVIKFMN